MKISNPFKKTVPISYEAKILISEIEQTKGALELAQLNFREVVNPALIDCYIYEVNAAQSRYQFLLRRAKQYGI